MINGILVVLVSVEIVFILAIIGLFIANLNNYDDYSYVTKAKTNNNDIKDGSKCEICTGNGGENG